MPCCQCNGSSCCHGCSCKKAGKTCINCLPSKRNQCENLSDSVGQDSASPTNVDDRMPKIDTQPLISCEPNPIADQNDLATASLPGYKECHSPSFILGCHEGDAFCRLIDDTYKEVIHWRRNLFKVPTGKN